MLEGQTFPEVFPDYTVPDNLKYILSNAVVSKVVMKQQKRQPISFATSNLNCSIAALASGTLILLLFVLLLLMFITSLLFADFCVLYSLVLQG